ncbi:MAG: amidohydrolase, partial [Mycolicibacterium sp.]|nr:amidohydrolase [Mycolicibacterium sp.]
MSTPTASTPTRKPPVPSLYPPEGWGAPKNRHGHATGSIAGLPAGTEIFSADNHISVADDIF